MKKILFLLFPFLVIIFLFHYYLVGQAVYGDGIFYWSYVRSIIIDHDLRLNDEISHSYDHLHNNTNIKDIIPKEDEKRIVLEYHLPFGPAIGWVPFFIIGDMIAHIAHFFNRFVVLNGYSDIYQISVGIGNIIFILLGLYFVLLLLKKYFSEKIATVTILILFFTTNLFYYGSIDVVNSHPFIFFLSSILVYYFFVKFSYEWYKWIFIGGLIGGLIITRTQEIIFNIFILAALINYWFLSKKNSGKIIKIFWFGVLGLIGMLIVISPQLLLLQIIYHGLFNSPYILQGNFYFLNPHLLGILINNKTGLIFTSPSIVIGVFGLILLAKQKKYIGILGLIFFLIEYYIISSWSFWDQAASYGIRMLISTFPIIAVGLGFVIEKIVKKFSIKFVYMIGLVLFIFNLAMIVRFHLLIKTATKDVTSITRLSAQEKLNTLLHTNFIFFK